MASAEQDAEFHQWLPRPATVQQGQAGPLNSVGLFPSNYATPATYFGLSNTAGPSTNYLSIHSAWPSAYANFSNNYGAPFVYPVPINYLAPYNPPSGLLTYAAGPYNYAAGPTNYAAGPSWTPQCPPDADAERKQIFQWIKEVLNPATRENALEQLSQRRDRVSDMGRLVWFSAGTVACLLQEIVSIYPDLLHSSSISLQKSNCVCNAITLLQSVASHDETRILFLRQNLPLFIYPFLQTLYNTKPFEDLRLTTLGVIGALAKNEQNLEVIAYFMNTEVVPLCLAIMVTGNDLTKTVAAFIIEKIMLNEFGLMYVCDTHYRFLHVVGTLAQMIFALAQAPSARLLKHVVRCYLRLTDHPKAREELRAYLPYQLKDTTFHECIKNDDVTKRWMTKLLWIVEIEPHTNIPFNEHNPLNPAN